MTLNKVYKKLSKLYKKEALHQSHLNFIIACLDNNVTPKGLQIKKVSLVASELTPRRNLLAKWNNTLRKASQLLLKHLKYYHKSVLIDLQNEIRKEEAILNNRRDCKESTLIIHQHANKTLLNYETYKRNKLERLIRETKGKRTVKSNRRSYKIKNKQNRRASLLNSDIGMNTVVNLSSVQLSTAKISLFSKGLTFCPLPPRPDTFQLKKDLTQFSRTLRLKEYFGIMTMTMKKMKPTNPLKELQFRCPQ